MLRLIGAHESNRRALPWHTAVSITLLHDAASAPQSVRMPMLESTRVGFLGKSPPDRGTHYTNSASAVTQRISGPVEKLHVLRFAEHRRNIPPMPLPCLRSHEFSSCDCCRIFTLGDACQQFIGVLFLVERLLQHGRVPGKVEGRGPGMCRAIGRDLVMFNLLRCCDESGISNRALTRLPNDVDSR